MEVGSLRDIVGLAHETPSALILSPHVLLTQRERERERDFLTQTMMFIQGVDQGAVQALTSNKQVSMRNRRI